LYVKRALFSTLFLLRFVLEERNNCGEKSEPGALLFSLKSERRSLAQTKPKPKHLTITAAEKMHLIYIPFTSASAAKE
jgi:hypothetical protein